MEQACRAQSAPEKDLTLALGALEGFRAQHDRGRAAALRDDYGLSGPTNAFQDRRGILAKIRYRYNFG